MNILAFKTLIEWIAIATASDSSHGSPTVFPSLADGVTLTTESGAWANNGTHIEIWPASQHTEEILISEVIVTTISGADEFQITLYEGAVGSEVELGSFKFASPASASRECRIDVCRRLARGTRLSARLANKTNADVKTATVSINYRSFK